MNTLSFNNIRSNALLPQKPNQSGRIHQSGIPSFLAPQSSRSLQNEITNLLSLLMQQISTLENPSASSKEPDSPFINRPFPSRPTPSLPINSNLDSSQIIKQDNGIIINGTLFNNTELKNLYDKFKNSPFMPSFSTMDLITTDWGYSGGSSVLNAFYNWVNQEKNNKGFEGIGNHLKQEGNNKNNFLVGTNQGDYILAKGGNDVIITNSGNDYINAGNGNDTIYAGNGNDKILTGRGNDTVYAGRGSDQITINSNKGNKIIHGGKGTDSVHFKELISNYSFSRIGSKEVVVTHKQTGSKVILKDIENFRFSNQMIFGGVKNLMSAAKSNRPPFGGMPPSMEKRPGFLPAIGQQPPIGLPSFGIKPPSGFVPPYSLPSFEIKPQLISPINLQRPEIIKQDDGVIIKGTYFNNTELKNLYGRFEASSFMPPYSTMDLITTNWGYRGGSSVLNAFYQWVDQVKDDRGFEGIGKDVK